MMCDAETALTSLWSTFSYRTSGADPKMRLRGDANLPAVDVFVVSSGQTDQTVRLSPLPPPSSAESPSLPTEQTFDCAVAAASMDYPPHRYRVMVLDPTGSLNLQRDITKHAKSQACPHLSYHRRALGATAGDMFASKANSINFGMMEAMSFGVKGPAEFIAVFDADVSCPCPLLSLIGAGADEEVRNWTDDPREKLPPRHAPLYPWRRQSRPR